MSDEEEREHDLVLSVFEDDAALNVAEDMSWWFEGDHAEAIDAITSKYGNTDELTGFWAKVLEWLRMFDGPVPLRRPPYYDDEIPF
ncbi:MAG: hypothetical protein AAFR02_00095 [Pseudomonadota bacterium]